MFKILTSKPTGKAPLGKARREWEDYIRMNLNELIQEIGLIRLRMWITEDPLCIWH